MKRSKFLAGTAVAGALLAATAWQARQPAARSIDPALEIGIGMPRCSGQAGGVPDRRLFFQLAQANKNELRPLGQLPSKEPAQA